MRVLFVTRNYSALRNFESVVRALVARGHTVELAALQTDGIGGAAMVERWRAESPSLTLSWAPGRPANDAEAVTQKVRLALDWVRYLSPAYASAPRLRHRAEERTPRAMLWLTRLPGARTAPVRQLLAAGLRSLERALPRVPDVDEFLASRKPDVVVLTPLIGLGSPELDYLRSAQALGLRTVFGVWSWDNLSSKALIRWVPDIITVWNETQRQEAVALHGVPAEQVVVTGAQCFDQWFAQTPTRDRGTFCARVGLPPDPPFLLYVCSALFHGSPVEATFVLRWIAALRNSGDARLREIPILVRPHPSRLKEWAGISFEQMGPVVLWGSNPLDTESKADYFDSLSYATAVVGLNTSAFLEAAIAGRPVATVLLDEFRENQEGTLHFPYLLNVAGGLLYTTRSLEAHVAQLGEIVRAPEKHAGRSATFVDAFLRPYGRAEAATPRLVAAIETLGQARAPAPRLDAASAGARGALAVLQRAHGMTGTRSLFWDPQQLEEERARTRSIRQHRWFKRRQQWRAQIDRAIRVARDRREKSAERREKERNRALRWREKRRRSAQTRRTELRSAIARRVKQVFGMQNRG